MTQYVAFIDNTNGTHVVVGVNEADIVSYRETEDGDGNLIEQPEYAMGSTVTMPEISTGITVEDARENDMDFTGTAHFVLENNGWRVVGAWEPAGDAYYATVERA